MTSTASWTRSKRSCMIKSGTRSGPEPGQGRWLGRGPEQREYRPNQEVCRNRNDIREASTSSRKRCSRRIRSQTGVCLVDFYLYMPASLYSSIPLFFLSFLNSFFSFFSLVLSLFPPFFLCLSLTHSLSECDRGMCLSQERSYKNIRGVRFWREGFYNFYGFKAYFMHF